MPKNGRRIQRHAGSVTLRSPRRQPIVLPEIETITCAPREEDGVTLINPKYDNEDGLTLRQYLSGQNRWVKYDPIEPREEFDDRLFPVLPAPFRDTWRTLVPDGYIRVQLLKLQESSPAATFEDLLSKEEYRTIIDVVYSELTRSKIPLSERYHRSRIPTPIHQFPLSLFRLHGLDVDSLWTDPLPLNRDLRKARSRAPAHFEVDRAWACMRGIPRELLRGDNGTRVTLRGYAFCQAVRRALAIYAQELDGGNSAELLRSPAASLWFRASVAKYFDTPAKRSLRWYSWIAHPLFYLLSDCDEWAWETFVELTDFLKWRRPEAELLRNWVTPPQKNQDYQDLKRQMLTEARGAGDTVLAKWFERLEQAFDDGVTGLGKRWQRVGWKLKDAEFIIPCCLLRLYRGLDHARYTSRIKEYVDALRRRLGDRAKEDDERIIWEFETMYDRDPFLSAYLNWEVWVGDDDTLRSCYAPIRSMGSPPQFEERKIIARCLPLFAELHAMKVPRNRKRGMQLCNALSTREMYPSGADARYTRDLRRAKQGQAK